MTGIDLLVDELKERGVQWISTLCGHGLNPLYSACKRAGIRLIDTRNEQTAAYMAECWGRLSRQVGVCAVSSGVAHANAMTGVVNAHFDGAPMLLITGAGSTRTAGMGHFQDLDQVALAAAVCKYARVVDVPERIPQFVHEAFAAALTGRPGPVHLTLPLDIQDAEVEESKLVRGTEGRRRLLTATLENVTCADEALISQAVDLLSQSERPLIIAGSGAYYAGAETALAEFVEATSIPIVVPIWDRGAVTEPMNQFMGVLGAASGGPQLLADADLIIMLGVAFDYRVGYLQPSAINADAQVIRIDIDPNRLHSGVAADLTIPADPRSALEQLLQVSEDRSVPKFSEWLVEAQRRRDGFHAAIRVSAQPNGRSHAVNIVDALTSVVTEETIVLIDGGNIGQWFHQLFCDRYPGRYLTCGASGVVGYGIAGAMAAKAGCPDQPVILLSGDGSSTFTIAELECAARQNLPFVMIIADDESWGITEVEHVKQYGEALSSTLGTIRFDLVAQGFGCEGRRIDHPRDIAPSIRQGLQSPRPTLIHVPTTGGFPGDDSAKG